MNEQLKHGDEWELLHLALVLQKKINNYFLFITFSFLYYFYVILYVIIYFLYYIIFKIYQLEQFPLMFHQQLQLHL